MAGLVTPEQLELEGVAEKPDIPSIVAEMTEIYGKLTIDILRIIVVPKGEIICGFRDFDLDISGVHLQPVAKDILIQHLRDHERYRLVSGDMSHPCHSPFENN
ncbi:hypothetical protein ACFLQ0_05275 [Nitrospinota bacterium]